MAEVRIVEVVDAESFGLIPPCADPGFDHRSCDYWQDADRGSKAARLAWLESAAPAATEPPAREEPFNPFAPAARTASTNPFAPDANPFVSANDPLADNPFAPRRQARTAGEASGPPKLRLLSRGLAVFGSYAKVLQADGESVAYCQYGPLSAYPRAQRTRELYPQLPDAPLPAVITCIATTAGARRQGWARRLVEDVCADLARRGFAAVEAYPEIGARENATSAATPAFWVTLGFTVAVPDERFPVVRRELD
ncbi:MAG TPA: hypothetical protein VFK54_05090 [Candidatus Limnocylindrales bacterium]|nr:hypothetical protein [Candidatus Limnocylindrales bacterium]